MFDCDFGECNLFVSLAILTPLGFIALLSYSSMVENISVVIYS